VEIKMERTIMFLDYQTGHVGNNCLKKAMSYSKMFTNNLNSTGLLIYEFGLEIGYLGKVDAKGAMKYSKMSADLGRTCRMFC
jgi:hypothetical protein